MDIILWVNVNRNRDFRWFFKNYFYSKLMVNLETFCLSNVRHGFEPTWNQIFCFLFKRSNLKIVPLHGSVTRWLNSFGISSHMFLPVNISSDFNSPLMVIVLSFFYSYIFKLMVVTMCGFPFACVLFWCTNKKLFRKYTNAC